MTLKIFCLFVETLTDTTEEDILNMSVLELKEFCIKELGSSITITLQ